MNNPVDPAHQIVSLLRDALPIATGRIRLRVLRSADAAEFLEYHGQEQIHRYLGHGPLNPASTAALLRDWDADPSRLAIAVEIDRGDALIGDITLRFRRSSAMTPQRTDEVEASLGYALHPDHHGNGLASEAVAAVVRAALTAGARRITADVFAEAAGSSALLRRLGFHRDGVDRAAVLAPDGTTWWDDERWSLLASDTDVSDIGATAEADAPAGIEPLPPWPSTPPSYGRVRLREVRMADAEMATELASDPYVPTIGSLPADPSPEQVLDWIDRQRGRHREGAGFSCTITDADSGAPVGHCGLWTRELGEGRASAGYAITPSARGHGYAADALCALTAFGWTLPGLHRISLFIEPWNTASIRVAERAGYLREGVLRRHMEIDGSRRDMLLYAALRPG